MSEKIYTLDELKSIIAPIALRYSVDRVYLFGSYARGDADAGSDVDLCIDASQSRECLRSEVCTPTLRKPSAKSSTSSP